jgi:hypothetical protein
MRRTVFPALAVMALVLSGCTAAESPSAQPASSSAESSTPTPTTAPSTQSPSAEPTATPVSEEIAAPAPEETQTEATCLTVLTDAEYASFEEDGLALTPDIFVLDDTMQSLIDAGGLPCYWTRSGGDVRVWYAQADRTVDEWEAQKQGLLNEGWTTLDGPVEGTVQAPTDNDDDYIPAMAYRDGTAYYVSYADLLGSVKALQ